MRGEDRISLLPDKLLHHILSFLDTQMVIKTTSLLSKRWTNLWTSIPTLSFNLASFCCPHHLDLDDRHLCFRRFIKRLISRRTLAAKVKKITLCFLAEPLGTIPDDSSEELSDSIRFEEEDRIVFKLLFQFAARNHVEELSIDGGHMDFSAWSRRYKTCRSLKLSGYLDGTWLPMANFQLLKSLEIENYYSPFYLNLPERDMSPSYPVLERLILRGCCFEQTEILAPKLEYLEMGTLSPHDDTFPEIVLCAPKLKTVKLDEIVPSLISTDDFLSLQNVEFSLYYLYTDEDTKQEVEARLGALFNLLLKANSVTLDPTTAEVYFRISSFRYFLIYVLSKFQFNPYTFNNTFIFESFYLCAFKKGSL